MKTLKIIGNTFSLLLAAMLFAGQMNAQNLKENPVLDEKVKKFLSDHSGQWHDLNISSADGQLLYDIIIKGNYKSALEKGCRNYCYSCYVTFVIKTIKYE